MIKVEEVFKEFGEVTAVNGVTFAVSKGEVFGFLGPNGAGKSTTINILCTLLRPDRGSAELAGYNVVEQPEKVRSALGIVFQDPSLDERLSALENLHFHALVYGVPSTQRKDRIKDLMNMVELWDRRDDVVRTFSGGMKRRLEIARGLLHHPQVLFLDEPTLGLDPQTRTRIWDYIHELRVEHGITIFMTTHYMDEAEHCERIAIIDHGRIIALDTPARLKTRVGGDVISLETSDNQAASSEIAGKFGRRPLEQDQLLVLEVPDGETFIPKLIKQLGVPIKSVSLRRPTLDDVFIKLTGRAMRDGSVGSVDRMRQHVRMRRSRR